MKKIFLCSLLLCIAFSVSATVDADSTNIMNAIFKIQWYSYDKLSDMYILKQYGSAVLISENVLLTNAHVITDDNNQPTLQYEACQTISDQETPKCFSTLQLLKYDKNTDLALLQIVNPSDSMPTPVTIWSGSLSVGAAIRVVGYPANGGETITTTQGTIAWFQNDYYKTDANIDEGNSWWWSFDSAWEFIGIPTYVINGQTTMWYIIPTKIIKEFIGWSFGTTYRGKYSTVFDKWIKSIYALQTQWIIDNNLFTTPDFNDLELIVDTVVEKKNNNLYNYSLYNKNDSSIDISSVIASDSGAITKYINDNMKQLSDGEYSPKKVTKRIGTTTRSVISFWQDSRVGYKYIQTTSTNKTYMEYTVLVDKEDIAADLSDLIGFVENITLKKNYAKAQVFNFPVIKLSTKWNIGIVKYVWYNWLTLNIFPTNGKYTTEVSPSIWDKWDTLKSLTAQLRDLYDEMWLTAQTETSKYPWSVSITTIVDENNKTLLSILGVKKYWTSNMFIHIITRLGSNGAKQEAIALSYKILGLQ